MRTRIGTLAAALACAVCVRVGFAQPAIEPSTVTALTMGPDQRAEVDEYADYFGQMLADDNPTARSRARGALLAPLREQSISVSFRMAYSDRLIERLEQIAQNRDTKIAINALRIAGELATDDSVQLLEDAATNDGDDIRYVAAMGLAETFWHANNHSPAVSDRTLQSLINLLEVWLGREDEPHVFDVVGQAMASAGLLSGNDERERMGEVARQAQAVKTAERVKRLNPGPDDYMMIVAVARTLESQRRLITDHDASDDVARAGAELAGQCIAYVSARAEAGDLDEQSRLAAWDLVKRAESLITFAHSALEPGVDPITTGVAAILAIDGDPSRFDDEAFVAEANAELIGPDGALCRPPFDLDAGGFVRR